MIQIIKHYEYSVTTQKLNEYLIVIEPWCALSAGSTITPNYVDNSTSSVAPWCSCSASGSRREDCDAFLEHFTDNICLRECHAILLECTSRCLGCDSIEVKYLSCVCFQERAGMCFFFHISMFMLGFFFLGTFSSVSSHDSVTDNRKQLSLLKGKVGQQQ